MFYETPETFQATQHQLTFLSLKHNFLGKLIEKDENLMKTELFVIKIILVTFGDINVNKNHF